MNCVARGTAILIATAVCLSLLQDLARGDDVDQQLLSELFEHQRALAQLPFPNISGRIAMLASDPHGNPATDATLSEFMANEKDMLVRRLGKNQTGEEVAFGLFFQSPNQTFELSHKQNGEYAVVSSGPGRSVPGAWMDFVRSMGSVGLGRVFCATGMDGVPVIDQIEKRGSHFTLTKVARRLIAGRDLVEVAIAGKDPKAGDVHVRWRFDPAKLWALVQQDHSDKPLIEGSVAPISYVIEYADIDYPIARKTVFTTPYCIYSTEMTAYTLGEVDQQVFDEATYGLPELGPVADDSGRWYWWLLLILLAIAAWVIRRFLMRKPQLSTGA